MVKSHGAIPSCSVTVADLMNTLKGNEDKEMEHLVFFRCTLNIHPKEVFPQILTKRPEVESSQGCHWLSPAKRSGTDPLCLHKYMPRVSTTVYICFHS